jgi:3-hydroxymyristoyl/3-hydroxydecanoyl-(acyl carrier protein) dehydratase
MTPNLIMDTSDIKKMLPHREPFLFIDRVIEFKPNEMIKAEKDLLPDMVFFAGHFPGTPIMPGVLTTEALAGKRCVYAFFGQCKHEIHVAGRSQRNTDLKSSFKEKIRRFVYVRCVCSCG